MTLPSPRTDFYKHSDYDVIKEKVFSYTNQVIDSLSFFEIESYLRILFDLHNYSRTLLFIGLIANIVVILFVTVAILLIYSLLMISIESKTYEFGVMRLAGLNTSGLVSLIAI